MPCIVCERPDANRHSGIEPDSVQYDCPRCGSFVLSGTADAVLPEMFRGKVLHRSMMSHTLRRMQQPDESHLRVIFDGELESFWRSAKLPSPHEQADNLVLWLANHQTFPHWHYEGHPAAIAAWIGMPISNDNDNQGWYWLRDQMCIKNQPHERLFEIQDYGNPARLQLTMPGWERYEALKKTNKESRTAFMAMKFNEPILNRMIADCFKPAVARAGFDLRILTDEQPAGLIDDQLKAAILSARFLVADLTHGSPGAYWEAGFAEGLGLPVIYTCEEKRWAESKTHFDTNHMVTIVWEADNPLPAANSLTATIRATLRGEAKQSDA